MAKRTDGDFVRKKNDAYDTPYGACSFISPFLPRYTKFVEPCAGKGNLVRELTDMGLECLSCFDIEPRDKMIPKVDMFQVPDDIYDDADYIITNPPWTRKILHPAIEKWAKIKPTWLLFDADWAFTKQASPYLKYCKMIVATNRLKWIEGSKHSAKDNTAWYLFDYNHLGKGTIFIGQ